MFHWSKSISFNKKTAILIIGIVLALLITLGSKGLFSLDQVNENFLHNMQLIPNNLHSNITDYLQESYQKIKLLLTAY